MPSFFHWIGIGLDVLVFLDLDVGFFRDLDLDVLVFWDLDLDVLVFRDLDLFFGFSGFGFFSFHRV